MDTDDNVENLILRVAHMIAYGVPVGEIREFLLKNQCDEGQAFLIFTAARLL